MATFTNTTKNNSTYTNTISSGGVITDQNLNIGSGYGINIGSGYNLKIQTTIPGITWGNLSKN